MLPTIWQETSLGQIFGRVRKDRLVQGTPRRLAALRSKAAHDHDAVALTKKLREKAGVVFDQDCAADRARRRRLPILVALRLPKPEVRSYQLIEPPHEFKGLPGLASCRRRPELQPGPTACDATLRCPGFKARLAPTARRSHRTSALISFTGVPVELQSGDYEQSPERLGLHPDLADALTDWLRHPHSSSADVGRGGRKRS